MDIIKIAQQIASGNITINKINCEFCKSTKIFVDQNKHLFYCEELEKLNSVEKKELVCTRLFKTGRGCPFFLSKKITAITHNK